MIPVRGYRGHRVAVLGLGRSGLPAARALRAGGAEVVCWDDGAGARDAAAAEGLALADLTRERSWEGVVALVVSPGIPHLYPAPHPAVAQALARGVAVDNDVGLFFRSWAGPDWDGFDQPPKVVCITGSNGKSTTTALTHHVLASAGRPAQLGGNIGRGVLDLDPGREGEVVVLELSSYQTELARTLTPDIAVFLNLSPDHLDRHGGPGGYFAAKARLFTEGGPERAVIGVDEVEGQYLANRMRETAGTAEPLIQVSVTRKAADQGWWVVARKGFLSEWRGGRQVASVDLRGIASLPGAHNHQNACAAWAVARALGLSPRQIEAGMQTYPGLPHRSQYLGQAGGVRFVNDSKATNADAAEKALLAFDRVRWIAGGVPKAGGIAALRPLFPKVARAYLIGEAAPEFAATLGEVPHLVAGTMEAAFAAAVAEAEPGDTVLLAPACSSFDQYPNFEVRGAAFAALVAAHLTGQTRAG
jgi:UDP-N-acetylmuramoylalanine--D-glutamate ligase